MAFEFDEQCTSCFSRPSSNLHAPLMRVVISFFSIFNHFSLKKHYFCTRLTKRELRGAQHFGLR